MSSLIQFSGFSESGEMCAMKEVTLFADDAKSKESAQQLGQVNFFRTDSVDLFKAFAIVKN